MQAASTATADTLVHAIKHGSFPESEELLSTNLDHTTIVALLQAIQASHDTLCETVKTVSKQEAIDVDDWISQAKKVQADIAQCKEDARQIVQEYEQVGALRNAQDEAQNKSRLLQDEISFNETLEKSVQLVSQTSNALTHVDNDIRQLHLQAAAQALPDIAITIMSIPSDQTRALLQRLHLDLESRLSQQLKKEVDARFLLSIDGEQGELAILQHLPQNQASVQLQDGASQISSLSLDQILESAETLALLDNTLIQLSKRFDSLLLPRLHKRSKLKLSEAEAQDGILRLTLFHDAPSPASVVSAISHFIKYVHQNCPIVIQRRMVQDRLSSIIPLLLRDWLDAAIPTDLDQLSRVDDLQKTVAELSAWLSDNGYEEASDLRSWVDEFPRKWFSKRRTVSLDAIRKAFSSATGITRQVERMERQVLEQVEEAQAGNTDDEWADNWDDEDQSHSNDEKTTTDVDEDGSDAWGFDTDDQEKDTVQPSSGVKTTDEDQNDEADAWGWGDDDDTKTKPNDPTSVAPPDEKLNGLGQPRKAQQDVILRENYTITDVPDYILEQIGRDLSDHDRLSATSTEFFKFSATAPPSLNSLPVLTLAMFRAIAPSSYQSEFSPSLSNMNIYNDTLYINSRLSEDIHSHNTSLGSLYSPLKVEMSVLEKFARQIYTSELSTHRTVLIDLLDTAQGFTSCSRSPFSETCETAISSATDYVRSIHSQWSSILSSSHLCQSIGSLVNSVMRKIIEDIEDMEDISEPESRKLVSLCEPVSALQDLFHVDTPGAGSLNQQADEETSVSTIALHCASYLRFQYLQQILESNLVDIRYLWTDAGLSLEFRSDEVVDLIKALFAESPQRRGAINAIK